MYRNFNADYGVLIGRVTANNGVGVPNAKISIFIPLDPNDEKNSNIVSIYPYKTVTQKNRNGKRYNLLPRVGKYNIETGLTVPKQPVGSFPIKEEIVSNSTFLDVYNKYYKYTTKTNESGDYMIFGVPIGSQSVHMSVDITDIGRHSMTPSEMVVGLGYSPNLFTDDNTKIKESNELSDLPHIETQDIVIDVAPFWGDTKNFEIGITRQDFKIRAVLSKGVTIFGTVFTDGDGSMWAGDTSNNKITVRELYRITSRADINLGIGSKRNGRVTEKNILLP